MQDKIFSEFLVGQKRPEIAGFVTGQHDSLTAAQKAGAKEFASIAGPSTGGSYCAGSGNKASRLAGAFCGALTGARAGYRDRVTAGVPAPQAYKVVVAEVSNLPSTPAVSISSPVPANAAELEARQATRPPVGFHRRARALQNGRDLADRVDRLL